MKHTKMIEATGWSLALALSGAPALAQPPATGGTLLVSAPGALGAAGSKPSPAPAPVKQGAAEGEAKPQPAPGGNACSAESPESCSETEAPRTGLLSDSPAPRSGSAGYGAGWFSSPSYGGGGGGGGLSPRSLSAAAAGGGMGSPPVPFVPGAGPVLPGPGILPNICLP